MIRCTPVILIPPCSVWIAIGFFLVALVSAGFANAITAGVYSPRVIMFVDGCVERASNTALIISLLPLTYKLALIESAALVFGQIDTVFLFQSIFIMDKLPDPNGLDASNDSILYQVNPGVYVETNS